MVVLRDYSIILTQGLLTPGKLLTQKVKWDSAN